MGGNILNLIRKRLQIIAFTLLLSVKTVIGANVISDSNNKVASTEVKAATTIPAYKDMIKVECNHKRPADFCWSFTVIII